MAIAKSIGAIIGGFLVVVLLSVGTDFVLESLLHVFPPQSAGPYPTWMLVLAFIYRSVFAATGGYVTAMLAPTNKMRHVIVLGVLGILGGVAGIFAGWNLSDHWYPIALAVTAFPLVYLGGWYYTRRSKKNDLVY